jgi:hypothetical protein
MKNPFLALAALLALPLLAGCGRSSAHAVAAPEPAPAATFKSGRGLQLSPAAVAFIGLQSAEVGARDFGALKGAAAVPVDALLRTAKGDFVWVGNGGWFLRTPVKLGPAEGGWVAVAEGLYEGDTVVIAGARALWLAEIQAVNGGVGCADGH